LSFTSVRAYPIPVLLQEDYLCSNLLPILIKNVGRKVYIIRPIYTCPAWIKPNRGKKSFFCLESAVTWKAEVLFHIIEDRATVIKDYSKYIII